MNMVIFGILQPSTATLQLKKKPNNWNRTTDEEEPAWASESIQRLHPLQCESTWTQTMQHNTLLQISCGYRDMDAYVHVH